MQIIAISDAERKSGNIRRAHLQNAVKAVREDGFVGLLNVAEVAHIDAVNRQMVHDIEAWNATASAKDVEPVRGGNFTPSRRPELLFQDILLNPIVARTLGELMGREVVCGMYSSNVTMPGLGEQELHVDQKPNNADDDLSGPCHAIVVNFPLVDFTEENGATELWPGTQHLMREPGEFWVSHRLQDARRAVVSPVRAILPRGAVLIRDIRLWHRGILNRCDYIRPMIAMILNGDYRPGHDPVERIPCCGPLPRAVEPMFRDNPVIYYNATFVDEEIAPCPGHMPPFPQVAHEALPNA